MRSGDGSRTYDKDDEVMAELMFEPFSGVSGDMIVAALMELADAEEQVCALPEKLNLPEVEVSSRLIIKNGIECRKIDFIEHKKEEDKQGHHHDHDHGHSHGEGHGHHHHGHHRHLSHIHALLEQSSLAPSTIAIAKAIFQLLAEAEASVHGTTIEKVHFHEVGAIDSIFDITAAALLIDRLGVTKTYTDPVCTGFGFVMTDHGKMPVPAPATFKLLQGIPTVKGDVESEMSTPTGAAILRYLKPESTMPTLTIHATGYGAGTKDFEQPNLLRISTCSSPNQSDALILLQSNIDDMSPEFAASDFLNELIEQGALDAYLSPLVMKKGRAGVKLECLCKMEDQKKLSNYIMENTSTIGVRMLTVQRDILARQPVTIQGQYGEVAAKKVTLPSGVTRIYPEYEACKTLAHSNGLSTYAVYLDALASTKA